MLNLLGSTQSRLSLLPEKVAKTFRSPKKYRRYFLGKGETSVKANKTAFAVLFAKFAVFRLGGERGIRTPGTLSRTHAFQACALNRSTISPISQLEYDNTNESKNQANKFKYLPDLIRASKRIKNCLNHLLLRNRLGFVLAKSLRLIKAQKRKFCQIGLKNKHFPKQPAI